MFFCFVFQASPVSFRKLVLKYFGNSTRRNPRRWLMSIPPLQARTVWSFMVTLTDLWLSVTSTFCGTAGMFVWISARAVHICQEVLVWDDVGCLVAWIKWMSSSTRSMKFPFFERKLFFLTKAWLWTKFCHHSWSHCLPKERHPSHKHKMFWVRLSYYKKKTLFRFSWLKLIDSF